MEARPEPSGSAEMLSSGPRSALNPAALWLLPSAASRTTGPAAEYMYKEYWNTKSGGTYLKTDTQKDQFKEQRHGSTHAHIHTHR